MSPKRILLVEDNPDDERLILMALDEERVADDVVVARDGKEAVDFLLGGAARSRELPVVVILDLKLPKLNGLDVLARIRAEERTRLQPVVILTSSDENEDRRRSYALGANSYVCKPMDADAFLSAVKSLGRYWLDLNKTPRD